MQAKDIMTKEVVTVEESTSLEQVIQLLVDKQVSGLIVTDADNQVLGVISEKDVLVAYDFLRDVKNTISDFFNRDVISVSENTDVDEISRIFVQRNIKRVPVVKGQKLLGLVSRRDVLKAIHQSIQE